MNTILWTVGISAAILFAVAGVSPAQQPDLIHVKRLGEGIGQAAETKIPQATMLELAVEGAFNIAYEPYRE